MNRGLQMMIIAVLVLVVGLSQGNQWAEAGAYALLLMCCISALYYFVMRNDIQVTREVPRVVVGWGEELTQSLRVVNRSRLPIPNLRVTEAGNLPDNPAGFVTTLAGKRDIIWEFSVACRHRGRWQLGPVDITMSDPMALFPRKSQVAAISSVLVLPRWIPITRCAFRLDGMIMGEATGQGRIESPPTVAGVRTYSKGDAYFAIDWRASARQGTLMTRQFEPEIETSLWLAVDVSAVTTAQQEEVLVTAAASIGMFTLQQKNLRVGVITNGSQMLIAAPDRRSQQRQRVLELLAEVHAGTHVSLEQQLLQLDQSLQPGKTVIIFTAQPAPAYHSWLTRWQQRGIAVRVVVVTDTAAIDWSVPIIQISPKWSDVAETHQFAYALETVPMR